MSLRSREIVVQKFPAMHTSSWIFSKSCVNHSLLPWLLQIVVHKIYQVNMENRISLFEIHLPMKCACRILQLVVSCCATKCWTRAWHSANNELQKTISVSHHTSVSNKNVDLTDKGGREVGHSGHYREWPRASCHDQYGGPAVKPTSLFTRDIVSSPIIPPRT